ncbi:spike base protein, RCAP_Rcc01079 family [Rhodobacter capsulatus]|jgi:hypothetical protein|uniref:Uncharacterized protein n=2 Tax=root TaxID=1 RepID=D5AR33_RHOCB|nr:hypothetical protein [Rhodobacter capsulatus]6TB9_A1 Chain A1, Head spike base Rcc01079 [Rhodobacter capsulatus]6TB9_A2 Chain A2, Head spike base Rcc01079 [Rhodobacter capsulatus]6TB9_A3 Chain A3, Head spike base Rcc01079 [Rhodobacter capsulatus]6TB9_B2 Chain B2, Head spike base Rcc01079 [Rhodobacter capsulatus]6TB9_B3 Chain B3, Head spike base Rcc01079 [Rhodobacter capsulatus]6TB9_C2 Chain C2, Head spike base Rcc01079 [Rhodobacter capsulatus]6TB9_C3 Chain C3, Head spike base Rcc01079 [Rh
MDVFAKHAVSLESPAVRHYEITPSDSTDLARRPRALRVQTGGTLVLRDETGITVTYTVFAGEILPVRPVRVLATGTTATAVGWE